MKAFGLADENASAAVLEVPTPDAGPGEVRIRVRASSVNGFDTFVASGMARTMMEHRYPVVAGKDYAGVIESLGEGVTRFAVGDEVAGIAPPEPGLSSRGAYAEYVVVPAGGFIERKPENLDFERAASVGLAAATALVAVKRLVRRKAISYSSSEPRAASEPTPLSWSPAAGRRSSRPACPRTKSGSASSARTRWSTTRLTWWRPCGRSTQMAWTP